MDRKLLNIGLLIAALAIVAVVVQQGLQRKPGPVSSDAAAAVTTPSSVPAIRGKPVEDFALLNLDGATVHFKDFKGKVLLVNFWATWCAPCIIEIPWFIEFQKKYGPQGFEVIGISMDEDGVKAAKPYAEKHAMNYPVLIGDEKVTQQFGGIVGLPTSFLVDRNGKFYSMHRGLVPREEIEKELQTLLGMPAANRAAPITAPARASEPERHVGAPPSSPAPTVPSSQKG